MVASISRKNFIAVLAVILFQTGFPAATGVVGPSLKPSRLGQVIIWRGKKYTAIKSGKKLIWNKGVVVPVAKPSPTSNASVSPTAIPTPTPTSSQTSTPTPETSASGSFEFDLAASSEVPNGTTRIFYPSDSNAKGKGFVITREKNVLIAFDNNCTHETCPVELGTPHLVCYCHFSYFNKLTGAVEDGPASEPLRKYSVNEKFGRIIVTDTA